MSSSTIDNLAEEFQRHLASRSGETPPREEHSSADTSSGISPWQAALMQGVSASAVAQAAWDTAGWHRLDTLSGLDVSASFVERVPIGFARRHLIVALTPPGNALGNPAPGKPTPGIGHRNNGTHESEEGRTNGHTLPTALIIACAKPTPTSLDVVDVLGRWLDRPVEPVLAEGEHILRAINEAYQQRHGQADAVIETLERGDLLQRLQDGGALPSDVTSGGGGGGGGGGDLLDNAARAPVIQLVNLLLFEAVQQLASDIHVQPYEDKLVVRLRIDGVLFDAFDLPRNLLDELVSRVKVMGRMNIAEKLLPQDGRATVRVGDRVIDLRISTVPTSFGERVVVRLLDKSVRLYTLPELGMPPEVLERFRGLIAVEHGLVLVTGPTGSGKSTTLYAALQTINTAERNALTVEDPIEYQLPGVSQIQVASRKGMTFASALRSVLRQDPDIIMVGEIRDHETAVMAIQSALTGHLVFSTLHTNDAASAVTRLLDLGIEPYLVASSVVGVLAQRLVRQVCPQCAASILPPEAGLHRLGIEEPAGKLSQATLRRGLGCATCRQTGFRGRRGIFELMAVDEPLRKLIQQRATAGDIRDAAVRSGMRTLRDDGVACVLSGRTTVDEVLRVTVRGAVS